MSNFIGQTAEFATRLKKEVRKAHRGTINPEDALYLQYPNPDLMDKYAKARPKGSDGFMDEHIRKIYKRDGAFKPLGENEDKLRKKSNLTRYNELSDASKTKFDLKRLTKKHGKVKAEEMLGLRKPPQPVAPKTIDVTPQPPVQPKPQPVAKQPKPQFTIPETNNPSSSSSPKPSTSPQPKPTQTPPTPKSQPQTKSIPVAPKAKKFKLNKFGVGAGLLGGAAVVGGTMYGLNKLKQRREQNKRSFSRNVNGVFIADFAKPNFKNFADNNPLGKFFFKNADTVTRVKPGDIAGKTTSGLWNSGKTFSKRGMAAVGVPLTGLAAWQGKKVYDDYAPKIKVGRKLNKMINSVTDKFKQN